MKCFLNKNIISYLVKFIICIYVFHLIFNIMKIYCIVLFIKIKYLYLKMILKRNIDFFG